MNERIKELLKQATIAVDPFDREWVFSRVDQAKFAELIVKECAGFAEQKYGNWYQYHSPDDAPGITIKKHFGVED